MKYLNIILSLATLTLFTACEDDQADKISAARDCLNDVTLDNYTTKAETCRDLLEGIETSEAYRLRCASYFLQEGLTASKMAEAVNSEDETGTTGDPMLAMMAILGFSDIDRANDAVDACNQSGLASYKSFAALGKTALSMGGGAINPDRPTVHPDKGTITAGVLCTDGPNDGTYISAMEYSKNPEECIASDNRISTQVAMENAAYVLQQTGNTAEKEDFADSVLLMEETKCSAENYADNKDLCDDIEAQKTANTSGGSLDKEAFADDMLSKFLTN